MALFETVYRMDRKVMYIEYVEVNKVLMYMATNAYCLQQVWNYLKPNMRENALIGSQAFDDLWV